MLIRDQRGRQRFRPQFVDRSYLKINNYLFQSFIWTYMSATLQWPSALNMIYDPFIAKTLYQAPPLPWPY